jgi:ABC-2 type transport system permease protein
VTPQYARAIDDVYAGVGNWPMWSRLGWREIRRRYRRTVIGPFWTSVNLATMVFAMGFLWAALFGQQVGNYMPYLCAGLVTWQFIGSVIGEGATVFTSNANLLTSIRIPQSLLVATMIWRNVIVLFHNLGVFVVVMLIWRVPVTWNTLLFLPGLVLLALNGLWVATLTGVISTRLRANCSCD